MREIGDCCFAGVNSVTRVFETGMAALGHGMILITSNFRLIHALCMIFLTLQVKKKTTPAIQ